MGPLALEAVALCPTPPHPSWWATAVPVLGTCVRRKSCPSPRRGQFKKADIHQTLSQALHQAFRAMFCLPQPLPRAAVGGEETEGEGKLLDFQVQGAEEVGHISACLVFQVSFLSWGWCSGTPPSSLVPREMSVIPCGPLGKQVWKSCGVGAMPGWRVGASTRRTAAGAAEARAWSFGPQAC